MCPCCVFSELILTTCMFYVVCLSDCIGVTERAIHMPTSGNFLNANFRKLSIARRHGHVFRMALHNEGDRRMETWQRARRASCHVSIRQSPSCVMPFWTHAKCLLAFISYLPMWIKAKYTSIKTVYSPRFMEGHIWTKCWTWRTLEYLTAAESLRGKY